MKKLLSIVALLGALGLSTMASAAGEVYIQGGISDSNGTKGTGGAIGYGFTNYSHDTSGILYGTSLFFGGSSKNIYYGGDARLGVSTGSLGVYGIAGALVETVSPDDSGNGITSYGFGHGAGVEYRIKKIIFAFEYKKYSMSDGAVKTTTEQNHVLLKYRF